MCFFQKRLLPLGVPIMKYVSHDQDLGLGQRVFGEIPGNKPEAVPKPERSDVSLEYRLHDGKLEPSPREVFVRKSDLDGHSALGRSHVEKRLVIGPGEL